MSERIRRYVPEDRSAEALKKYGGTNEEIKIATCDNDGCRFRWVIPFACYEPLRCPLCAAKEKT